MIWCRLGGVLYHIAPHITTDPILKFTMELLTHFSQCLFMFGIALERYILICHASRAKELLTRKKRIGFCCFLILFFGVMLALPAVAYQLVDDILQK